MSLVLFRCDGGTLVLPDRHAVLLSREDGGNLVVNPPRTVTERSELTPAELSAWGALVAAAGRAMLDSLPQLDGGCINYWEAGNWALNDAADPVGPKSGREHKKVHLHLLGRSPQSTHPAWRWGESPRFPDFAERHDWASSFERLTPRECVAVVRSVEQRLREYYGFGAFQIAPWSECRDCGYPIAIPAGS